MKKNFLVASIAIVAVCGVVAFAQDGTKAYSDASVLLENVEALANGESGVVCRANATCYADKFIGGGMATCCNRFC